MWGCFKAFCSYFNLKHQNYKKHNNQENLLPIRIPDENEDVLPLSSCKMFIASLLFRSSNKASAFIKYFVLALFSPLLLPLICAAFPFLCALELLFRICRWRWWRRRRRKSSPAAEEGCPGDGSIRGEDGGNGERLLQRYLEDQLTLVARSLYGDDDDEEEEIVEADVEYFDSKIPST